MSGAARRGTLAIALGCALLAATQAGAVDVALGSVSGSTGGTASVPVVLTQDDDDLSLMTLTIQQPMMLPALSPVAGPDQPNLETQDVFVDDLGSGTFRVTAFVRSGADMAVGSGHVVDLVYDLSTVPGGSYAIHVQAAAAFTTANAAAGLGAVTDGAIEVQETPIFTDDFESGNLSSWPVVVP